MLLSQFISLIGFICSAFWSFWQIILDIPLTNNVKFGDIIVYVICLSFLFFIIFRPIKKD